MDQSVYPDNGGKRAAGFLQRGGKTLFEGSLFAFELYGIGDGKLFAVSAAAVKRAGVGLVSHGKAPLVLGV